MRDQENHGTPEIVRQQRITFGEMGAVGVRGVLIYCSDYRLQEYATTEADA
jgi:hypothetical protein